MGALPRFPSDSEPGSPSPFRCVTDFAQMSPPPIPDATNQLQSSVEAMPQTADINDGRTLYVYVHVPVPIPVMQHPQDSLEFQPTCKGEDDSLVHGKPECGCRDERKCEEVCGSFLGYAGAGRASRSAKA